MAGRMSTILVGAEDRPDPLSTPVSVIITYRITVTNHHGNTAQPKFTQKSFAEHTSEDTWKNRITAATGTMIWNLDRHRFPTTRLTALGAFRIRHSLRPSNLVFVSASKPASAMHISSSGFSRLVDHLWRWVDGQEHAGQVGSEAQVIVHDSCEYSRGLLGCLSSTRVGSR
ncbi:hypothetical protein BDN72DRAFT_551442 [Pluteus cervinus]|uniref:Uncharacterized protein n=1 Tax=Pluteus cervinus TaxID=181527 RepID=A0ACD3AX10_9AGAR|nr:hypothetical protein BDN72DRAFT_551442 [Pluteus cervinus]